MDSLINQTLKDIEIIVVNDASPDNSEDIVLEYMAQDSRIVYIKHEENKCLGGARNTGMKAARGQYIAFVDSDDYVDRHLYAAVVEAFEKYDVDMVCIPFVSVNEEGKRLKSFYKPHKSIYQARLDNLLQHTHFSAWSKVYRREDIEHHSFVFPQHVYWEDISFWTEICALMHPKVMNLSPKAGGFYHYRQQPSSITSQGFKNFQSMPYVFLYLYQNLKSRGLIADYYQEFYHLVSQQTAQLAWRALSREYKSVFVENFIHFVRQIVFTGKESSISPAWYILREIQTPQAAEFLMEMYVYEFNIEHNFWYSLSQLSLLQKISKIYKACAKRLSLFIQKYIY